MGEGPVEQALGLTWTEAWLVVVTATAIYVVVVVFSRLFGPRQFASSSTYDLAFIFALGSLVGRVILVRTSLLAAVLGLATMFVLHAVTRWLQHHIPAIHHLVQNEPVLLMANGEVLEDLLAAANTSHLELYAALRLKGFNNRGDVAAAVLELNGQISVIGSADDLDPEVVSGVVGRERLAAVEA